jgi:hypothetical protein
MEKTVNIPFGLMYEEKPSSEIVLHAMYDEEEDISVIIDPNGQKIPCVENSQYMGTSTATKAVETSDEDPGTGTSTRTVTNVTRESSDSDEGRASLALGTRTETFVSAEQSDEDPGIDVISRPPVKTGTATSVAKEETDSD